MLETTFQFLTATSRRWRVLRSFFRELFRSESEKRAIKLLCEWLSPEQLAQFEKHESFEVTGCQSGKRYRIRYGTAANIYELDQYGHPKSGWCLVPNEPLVPGDVMLAQKIALETDELSALAVAKSFRPVWH
ncbi:hypothetical protein [Bradyrhizobium sp. OAE829]|uniref:hypothetical protein n=1 Tax=Bradyrhizobium sp. OAE829 TaxID=2663807 RepID=UPI001A0B3DB4